MVVNLIIVVAPDILAVVRKLPGMEVAQFAVIVMAQLLPAQLIQMAIMIPD
jgi:hypothetical protein